METTVPKQIADTKQFRQDLDAVLSNIKRATGEYPCNVGFDAALRKSRERSLAITKIQEAIMWLGMDLKAMKDEGLGGENPYPNSYNPQSAAIEPTADGLKL